MAGSVNKVILIGNLGKDPELRILDSGVKLVRFTLATTENYTDKTTGERKSMTDWHNIVLWRGLADIADRYLKKGHQVYIEGKIRTRTWTDETGANRYTTEIVGDNMQLLTSRAEAELIAQREETKVPTPDFTKIPPPQPPVQNEDLLSDNDEDDLPF